jgi:ArsR family transcriptional regulator, arsenate/arsenite/antimonite-responsive transcriptional repressor
MATNPPPARSATSSRRGTTSVPADRARPRRPAAVADAPTHPRISTATLFELLSDGTRRRLLTLLLDEREVCVCRLVDALQQPQPKVSRHLAALREAGVLVSRRQRTWIMYRLDPELPGWAVRVLAMLSEGARHEPDYADDCKRLARAKRCGEVGFPNSP